MNLLPATTLSGDNRIHVADALDLLRSLGDNSIDAALFDPPYGLQIDKWDEPINIPLFLSEIERALKPQGFCAFTTQMPMMTDWLFTLRSSGLRYKDHIAWIKRKNTNITTELLRAHESLFIYSKGIAHYHQTKGAYTDVKTPGVMFDTIAIEGINRYIKEMELSLKRGERGLVPDGKRNAAHSRMAGVLSERAPEQVNFTNVWSFLPENLSTLNTEKKHATMKPLKMWMRLVELTTLPDALILDPFVGSGTTAVACVNTGRRFICGDQSAEYVAIARERVRKAQSEARQLELIA